MNNIFRCFKCTEKLFLLKSYTTYVRPLLECATEVWSPTAIGLIEDLEKIQRTFTRRLFNRAGLPDTSYENRLLFLGLERLDYRRAVRDLSFVHKTISSLAEFDYSYSLKRAPLSRTLRNNHHLKLSLPFTIKAKKRSTFASRCVAIWNSLPLPILDSPHNVFKIQIKRLPIADILQETVV